MTSEPIQEPTAEMKEALRGRLIRIFHDFDHRLGAFDGLAYFTPRDLIIEEWAQLAGRQISELRDAVTAWRTDKVCKNGLDPLKLKAIEDLKKGVEIWRQLTGYRRKPTDLRNVQKYTNRTELASYVVGLLSELGLEGSHASRHPTQLEFGGLFVDAFGHRVPLGGQIKFAYGGGLRASFHFPYYDHERDPTLLSMQTVLGISICFSLGVDPPDGMVWTAEHSKDSFPNIDGYFRLLGAVCAYLRARNLPPSRAIQ